MYWNTIRLFALAYWTNKASLDWWQYKNSWRVLSRGQWTKIHTRSYKKLGKAFWQLEKLSCFNLCFQFPSPVSVELFGLQILSFLLDLCKCLQFCESRTRDYYTPTLWKPSHSLNIYDFYERISFFVCFRKIKFVFVSTVVKFFSIYFI